MNNIVFSANNGINSKKDANDLRMINDLQEWCKELLRIKNNMCECSKVCRSFCSILHEKCFSILLREKNIWKITLLGSNPSPCGPLVGSLGAVKKMVKSIKVHGKTIRFKSRRINLRDFLALLTISWRRWIAWTTIWAWKSI